MIRPRRDTMESFLKAYQDKACNIAEACRAVEISRVTYLRWRKAYKWFDQACWETEEALLDFGESKLMVAINKGEGWAICFFLKCKGKSRGWVEKHIIEGDMTLGGQVQIYNLPDNKRGDR